MNYCIGMLRFCVLRAISLFKMKVKTKGIKNKPIGLAVALDPATIPKFVNQLSKPPVYIPFKERHRKKEKKHHYFVDMSQFKQQILPEGLPETTVWGYGGLIKNEINGRTVYHRSIPGPTFEAIRNIPVTIKWINSLKNKKRHNTGPDLHSMNSENRPTVVHLHGGEISSVYDGNPDAWYTNSGKKGPAFVTSLYSYPNEQVPATLWYHDNAAGMTRFNIYAGLAGFYLLRGPNGYMHGYDCVEKLNLPEGKYEFPVVIQDRSFNTDGSFMFYNAGINPEGYPFFFGNTIMVNGSVWPNLDVERRQYRFRLLNGSNARFYNLKMSNGMRFTQIGTDGGFLRKPVKRDTLLLAPGERADILIDFSGIETGTSIVLLNTANAPFPAGDPADQETIGQIMQFTVPISAAPPVKPPKLPSELNTIPVLTRNVPQRTLTLNEVMGKNGPVKGFLNGQKWEAPVTELPIVGSTEDWVIANLTADTHPIHLHLVQFQLISRQDFKADEYKVRWEQINGMPPLDYSTEILSVNRYLTGKPVGPDKNEKGWKDTVRINPNQATRIRVRFAPQDIPASGVKLGENRYSFDPTRGPGYEWHGYILDNDDNEMMRPFLVL